MLRHRDRTSDIVIEPAISRHRQSGLCFDRRCKVTGGKLLISERWLR